MTIKSSIQGCYVRYVWGPNTGKAPLKVQETLKVPDFSMEFGVKISPAWRAREDSQLHLSSTDKKPKKQKEDHCENWHWNAL